MTDSYSQQSRSEGIQEPHKIPFAREDMGPVDRLTDAITQIKPSVLIGRLMVLIFATKTCS